MIFGVLQVATDFVIFGTIPKWMAGCGQVSPAALSHNQALHNKRSITRRLLIENFFFHEQIELENKKKNTF